MKRIVSLVFVCFALTAVFASAGVAATLYATDDVANTINTVNESTAATAALGPSGQDLSFTGLAYDTSTGTMYVSDLADPSNSSYYGLGKVDIATGAVTFIGDHKTSNNIWGLAYDSKNNILYGADEQNACLVAMNRGTGAASACIGKFAASGSLTISGLAYDPSSDTLYAINYLNLYTIDRTSGLAHLIGPTGSPGSMTSLDVDHDTGVMYGGDSSNDLWTINKSTGAATKVGATGLSNLEGLASGPAPAVTAIPALTHAGLIGLVLLLAGLGMAAMRFGRG